MVFEESAENGKYFCKANVDFFSIYDVLVWSQQIPTLLSNILFPTPIFFRILDFQAESFEGLSYSRPDSDIYGVSMSKKFAWPFWPSWEGWNRVKMLDFLWRSAKQFSALERGREKPKHVLESPDISLPLVDKNWELTLKAETKITKINFWPKS